MGSVPSHEDDISRRKGEMLGNRVPGLNRPTALPTEGLGMVSKSHLTVKPIAKDSAHRHGRGESQSLGSHHRRFTSYSTFTSPSLSAYDGEGDAGLLEVDEFGGLDGLDRPHTSFSHYSPTLTPPPLPSPEVTAIDKIPDKVTTYGKLQRRVVSDFRASYGVTRAPTTDPEMLLQLLDEATPLSLADRGPSSQAQAESIPASQTRDDSEEPEVLTEPIQGSQASPPDRPLPSPTNSSHETTPETVFEPISDSIPVVDVTEEGVLEDDQGPLETNLPVQHQDQDLVSEVPKSNPTPIPPVIESADAPPQMPYQGSIPSTPTPVADIPSVIEKVEQPATEPVSSPDVAREYCDAPRTRETPAPPTFALPSLPIEVSSIEGASSESQTPPESPRPASSASTSTSDLSDSRFDYHCGSDHPDPDHDLFVLPLPKDDELPRRPITTAVAVPQSMHQVFASPLPTLQPPIDFPAMATRHVLTQSSDPDISFTGDESLALDASQAEIVIAQSEMIRPASRTLVISVPPPSPTTTAFRVQTPPLPEESTPLPDRVDDTQVSPPRIRKKLYTNHSVPPSFKDTLSPPPTRQSFSAVVHHRARTPTHVPDRIDSVTPKPTKPANTITTPKRKETLYDEPLTPASSGSELAFLAKTAAILEARLERGDSYSEGLGKLNPAKHSVPSFAEPPRSRSKSQITKVKSASTPTLVPSSTPRYIPPVPDLVYDDGSSNSGLSLTPQIPTFLPQSRSRKSGAHEDADRKSLAPSHKSRKSEKSVKEKDKDSIPRARKLSARLRSLASSSTNSLRSLGRPSLSSETSISFDSPTTVSIEPLTPPGSGESGRFGGGIGSPGSRSQISHGSGSEWNSPPRRRDVLGRASSFADRFMSRVGKTKPGFLDNSQGNRL